MICKACDKETGGFCPGCDEPACLSCLVVVIVKVRSLPKEKSDVFDQYRHRCPTCAAVMVLTDPRVEATWRKTA